MQKSGHVDDDVQAFYEMGGRKSRNIGEVLEWYRGEDAGDLKKSELRKSDQKVVVDEKLVQNGVMDGELVKNFVMDAKIDPKVVMVCPYSKMVDVTVSNP